MLATAGCAQGPGADAFEPSRTVRPPASASSITVFDTVATDATDVLVASAPPIPSSTSQLTTCLGATIDGQAATDPFRSSTLIGNSIVAEAGDCGPRVVIGFTESGDLPAWGASYVDDPIADQVAGGQATLLGDATLLVTVGVWMGAMGVGYDGPTTITVDDVAGITELRLVANADGSSAWAIGLTAAVPYTVVEMENPQQIVVQFAPFG